MRTLWVLRSGFLAIGLLVAPWRAESAPPPQGTYYTFSYPATQNGYGHFTHASYEQGNGCAIHLTSFNAHITMEAAVPVFVPLKPGFARLFVLGRSYNGGPLELWTGDTVSGLNNRLGYHDVVSITAYSNHEVVVASGDGHIAIVDSLGQMLCGGYINRFFPRTFDPKDIGRTVRAWRTGVKSMAVLTENHFILYDDKSHTILILNDTAVLAGGAYRASFDLNKILTANGDEKHVWIVSDVGNNRYHSFSLFDLQSGNQIQRHTLPASVAGPVASPVYHDAQDGRSYFKLGDNLISVTETTLDLEDPAAQLTPTALYLPVIAAPVVSVVTPPAQGDPWTTLNPVWTNPPVSKTPGRIQLRSSGVLSNPNVVQSKWIPNSSNGISPSTIAPPPTIRTPATTAVTTDTKKTILGVEQTKAELTVYLEKALTRTLTPSKQVDSGLLVQNFASLPPGLPMVILDLPDAFLHPRGVQYASASLGLRAKAQSELSDWADAIWDKH